MGYTKIIQSGKQLEVYSFDKDYEKDFRQSIRKVSRKRKATSEYVNTAQFRSTRSANRARAKFKRIVTANTERSTLLAFVTWTHFEQSTTIEQGYKNLSRFWALFKKRYAKEVAYIIVPEWTKRGVLHFHGLVWGLERKIAKQERNKRNIQRLWAKGYVDVRNAKDDSPAIASYMGKYMHKGYTDSRLRNRRAYTCSRNIYRPTETGNNQLHDYLDMIIPDKDDIAQFFEMRYSTNKWLGDCTYQKIIRK